MLTRNKYPSLTPFVIMHFTTVISGALLSAAIVSAKTIEVQVGSSGLTYTPNNVTAAVGDEVQFTFYPMDHNVVQASFANPCIPMDGGFYSGFMPTSSGPANKTFTITVNNTNPIWFYCGQGTHCESGMVGVINQAYVLLPSSFHDTENLYTDMKDSATGNETINAFAAAAKTVSKSVNPTTVQGGVLNPLSSSAVTPSSSSTASAASPTMSSSSTASAASPTMSKGAAPVIGKSKALAGFAAVAGVAAWIL
jgi:plastocyanin